MEIAGVGVGGGRDTSTREFEVEEAAVDAGAAEVTGAAAGAGVLEVAEEEVLDVEEEGGRVDAGAVEGGVAVVRVGGVTRFEEEVDAAPAGVEGGLLGGVVLVGVVRRGGVGEAPFEELRGVTGG